MYDALNPPHNVKDRYNPEKRLLNEYTTIQNMAKKNSPAKKAGRSSCTFPSTSFFPCTGIHVLHGGFQSQVTLLVPLSLVLQAPWQARSQYHKCNDRVSSLIVFSNVRCSTSLQRPTMTEGSFPYFDFGPFDFSTSSVASSVR